MKVLGLIDTEADVVSKEYVDNKIKEVSKGEDTILEGYVKLDIPTLLIALPPASSEAYKNAGVEFFQAVSMFIAGAVDRKGKEIPEKYNFSALTQEKLYEIIIKDSTVYLPKDLFGGALDMLDGIKSTTSAPQE